MAKDKKPAANAGAPKPDEIVQAPISAGGEAIDALGRPFDDDKPERPPPGYNAGDEKQIEAAKKEDGQRRRHDRDFWHICMSTTERRGSLYRLLESCHVFSARPADQGTPYRHADPYLTYQNFGELMVGQRIAQCAMDASSDLYLKMLKEQKELRDAKERKQDG